MRLFNKEKLSKIIDGLIVLFCLNDGNMDYKANGQYPITVSLADYMKGKGYGI